MNYSGPVSILQPNNADIISIIEFVNGVLDMHFNYLEFNLHIIVVTCMLDKLSVYCMYS